MLITRFKLEEFSQYLGHLQRGFPFSLFKNFALEMVETVSEFINRAERTSDDDEAMSNARLSDLSLYWLLLQHGLFKQVIHDHPLNRWNALQHFLENGQQLFSINEPVVGSFYGEYGATGRFILDQKINTISRYNYFLILVDELDAPVFWPLAIHELAHCWLSSQDSVVSISSQTTTTLDFEDQESRIEESLCDAIATSVMGPSYVYSFINRLWTGFRRGNSPDYPENSFRLEVMVRILRKRGYGEELHEIEPMIRELGCVDWDEEEIVSAIVPIEEFAFHLPLKTSTPSPEAEITTIDDFIKRPPANLQEMFHIGWTLLNQSDVNTYESRFNRINLAIQKMLERNSLTFNT